MKYADYESKRKKLLNEAEQLINKKKSAEADSKLKEVEQLDSEWDKFQEAAQNIANYRALNCEPSPSQIISDIMENNDNVGKDICENYMLKKSDKMYDRVVKDRSHELQIINQNGALGSVVRGMVTGKWQNEQLKNIVTSTATGALIPEVLSSKIIDRARNVSLFTQAGVPVIPMDSNNVTISRIKNDPKFSFKKEGAEGEDASFELDGVTLNSKTCYGYAYVSLEAIKSSVNLDEILYSVFSEAIAQAIDNGMLYGQYNSETSEYESFAPSGIMNDSGINIINATAGSGYDDFIKAIGKIKGENGNPGIIGINSNTEELLSLLKTNDGQYLTPPKAYEDSEKIISNQLLHDDSQGDDALVFDPAAMAIGIQNNIQVKIIEDSECLKKGLVGFQIYSMVDCKAVMPKHICKISGIKNN